MFWRRKKARDSAGPATPAEPTAAAPATPPAQRYAVGGSAALRTCPSCGWQAQPIFDFCPRCHAALARPEERWAGATIPELGRYLCRRGVLTEDQLQQALARQNELAQKGKKPRFGELVVQLGFVSQREVDAALKEQREEFQSSFNG